jgi:hypothetical protein
MTTKSERLRRAMGAISQGEVEQFGEILLTESVVWHWPGRSSLAGEYRGRDATLGLLREFHRVARDRLHVEPLDILEGRDYLMSFTHVTADQEGRHLDVVMADAMRFDDDDRVVEFWTLSNDQDAVDAFIG